MNEKQFCFIICTNNDVLVQECINYINRLYVPEGYEYDIITIKEADSMTTGYNAAMKSTDAKYKIYMHQDVYIINRYFMYDLLAVFHSNHSIGAVGMVGYKEIDNIGVMWNSERFGMKPMYGIGHYVDDDIDAYRYSVEDGIVEVKVVDGLLIATAYDVEWDEEFDAWDFYDASQSIRFQDAGYKLVVPRQIIPWVIHDDGRYLNIHRYNKYRKLFLNKYIKREETGEKINVLFVYSSSDEKSGKLLKNIQTSLTGELQAEIVDISDGEPYHVIFRKIQSSNADVIIDINAAGRVFRTELNEMSYTILGNRVVFAVNDKDLDSSFFNETFNLSHFLCIEDKAQYASCCEETTHIPNLYNTGFQNDEEIKKWFGLMKNEMELL